jgi:hypothetical protein
VQQKFCRAPALSREREKKCLRRDAGGWSALLPWKVPENKLQVRTSQDEHGNEDGRKKEQVVQEQLTKEGRGATKKGGEGRDNVVSVIFVNK